MARPRAGLHVWMLQTELIPNLPGCGCERACRGRTWRGAITARPDLALCGKRGAFGCSVWKRFRCFFSWSLRTLPRRSRGARAHAAGRRVQRGQPARPRAGGRGSQMGGAVHELGRQQRDGVPWQDKGEARCSGRGGAGCRRGVGMRRHAPRPFFCLALLDTAVAVADATLPSLDATASTSCATAASGSTAAHGGLGRIGTWRRHGGRAPARPGRRMRRSVASNPPAPCHRPPADDGRPRQPTGASPASSADVDGGGGPPVSAGWAMSEGARSALGAMAATEHGASQGVSV